jgi:hypothetical protein
MEQFEILLLDKHNVHHQAGPGTWRHFVRLEFKTDYFNLLVENVGTINKSIQTLLDASKEGGV